MSGHALDGERSKMLDRLRRVVARCRGALGRRPAIRAARLTVGEAATEGWAAYGQGPDAAACPYADRRARDAWRSAWRAAEQFDRVFR